MVGHTCSRPLLHLAPAPADSARPARACGWSSSSDSGSERRSATLRCCKSRDWGVPSRSRTGFASAHVVGTPSSSSRLTTVRSSAARATPSCAEQFGTAILGRPQVPGENQTWFGKRGSGIRRASSPSASRSRLQQPGMRAVRASAQHSSSRKRGHAGRAREAAGHTLGRATPPLRIRRDASPAATKKRRLTCRHAPALAGPTPTNLASRSRCSSVCLHFHALGVGNCARGARRRRAR